MFFPFNSNLNSRFFWLAISIVCIFVACGYAWERFRPQLAQQAPYAITPEQIYINEVPDFLRTDVKAEVMAKLDGQPLNLLDRHLLQTIAEAFLDHRCVAGVYSIEKTQGRVNCLIEYRKPVAAVELIDTANRESVVALTRNSIVVDARDIEPAALERLKRIALPGLTGNRMFGGEPFEHPTLQQAIALATLLDDASYDEVVRILQDAALAPESFILQLRGGTRIVWGKAPCPADADQAQIVAAENDEADHRRKLVALQEAIQKFAHGQSDTDFQDLDIRSGNVRRVIPQRGIQSASIAVP
jgi:hypothetical protein